MLEPREFCLLIQQSSANPLFFCRRRDARSGSRRWKGSAVVWPLARSANNRPTSCGTNRNDRWPDAGMRSNQGTFFSLRNNRAGRKMRSGAPDASATNESAKQEFPSVDCRKRSLFPEILPDMMLAMFQMHPYRGRNRRCARKSNRVNGRVKYALWARRNVAAAERLRFHPASAYKYSGEREASKVPCHVMANPSTSLRTSFRRDIFDCLVSPQRLFDY